LAPTESVFMLTCANVHTHLIYLWLFSVSCFP